MNIRCTLFPKTFQQVSSQLGNLQQISCHILGHHCLVSTSPSLLAPSNRSLSKGRLFDDSQMMNFSHDGLTTMFVAQMKQRIQNGRTRG